MKSMYDTVHRLFFATRGEDSTTSPSDCDVLVIADLFFLISLALAQMNKFKKEEHVNGTDE